MKLCESFSHPKGPAQAGWKVRQKNQLALFLGHSSFFCESCAWTRPWLRLRGASNLIKSSQTMRRRDELSHLFLRIAWKAILHLLVPQKMCFLKICYQPSSSSPWAFQASRLAMVYLNQVKSLDALLQVEKVGDLAGRTPDLFEVYDIFLTSQKDGLNKNQMVQQKTSAWNLLKLQKSVNQTLAIFTLYTELGKGWPLHLAMAGVDCPLAHQVRRLRGSSPLATDFLGFPMGFFVSWGMPWYSLHWWFSIVLANYQREMYPFSHWHCNCDSFKCQQTCSWCKIGTAACLTYIGWMALPETPCDWLPGSLVPKDENPRGWAKG